MKYNFKKIEKRWQNFWLKKNFKFWRAKDLSRKKKIYILEMFPYLSGEGLHLGHTENFVAGDILARYFRMKGYNVLHPIGWDAFGLPTENFAIKNKINPMKLVPKYKKRFKQQMYSLGLSYDWSREIDTTDPEYYKWTQWMFLQMYKAGLVYKKEAPVNFCPSCKTTIANEEATGGECERCGSRVEIRYFSQWHIRITKYAKRLLRDLEKLDWPEKIKKMQKDWIGESNGFEVDFYLENNKNKITVFTTRLDTIFGVSFLVLAPEHPMVKSVVSSDKIGELNKFLENIGHRLIRERKIQEEIIGFFTGSYAIHPLTKERLPIFISDYVLMDYGTGAIMGVPAHDERDYKFAQKFNLPIIEVIKPESGTSRVPFEEDGILFNSQEYSGLDSKTAREIIGKKLKEQGMAREKTYYKLRDWIFARQRYWGEPIPLVYCEKDGIVPVPEKELPIKLPKVKYYEPTGTGESPLAKINNWIKTKCPKCHGPAKREADTMPQWAGSSWYYLRYLDPKNKKTFASKKKINYWMPVDLYIGGAEHAVLHLLYARFWYKFLYDLGLVSTDEPFKKLFNQGLILGPDGQKMSKSRGNVINPDDIIKQYGADSLRMYIMFLGPLDEAKAWINEGIIGIYRFLQRIYNFAQLVFQKKKYLPKKSKESEYEALIFHTEIDQLIQSFKFNVAISKMMVYEKKLKEFFEANKLPLNVFLDFIKVLFVFAPFISQEIYSWFKPGKILDFETWPKTNKKLLTTKEQEIVIQVNGKKVEVMKFSQSSSEQEILELVLKLDKIKKLINNKAIKKTIFIPGKVLNIVV